jgi:type I restriction enzyme S subunit
MGSTHKTIYMPDIESIRVPVPPMDEQHRLVEWVWSRLRRIDAIVDTLTAQIALLRERRQALITAAVTGEIGV